MTLETETSRTGRYYQFDRSLYHVEEDLGDHVLVEDCSSGELLALPAADLARMIELRRPALHSEGR